MFKWSSKNKKEESVESSCECKKNNENNINENNKDTNYKNYEVIFDEEPKIKIKIKNRDYFYWYSDKRDIYIEKSSIISHTKDSIVYKDYTSYYNFQKYKNFGFSNYKVGAPEKSIERKKNFIKYRNTIINTYTYSSKEKIWDIVSTDDNVAEEVLFEKTPLEVFKEEFKSKYKLIETEDELNKYLSSSLDCDTWCRKKLCDKMKELGLGNGFINQFADLVGNSLDKYHAMIELANEVTDKDTLMYLYTYKFRK